MAGTAYIDLNGLRSFKLKQDAYNLGKFASLFGGKISPEQLPSYVDDIIEGYTKNEEGVVSFYADSDCTVAIKGEKGKIYYDLAATVDGSYRYSGSQFVAVGNSVSTADKAVNDANGNPIIDTYATKDELGTVSTTPATKTALGVVQIGDNISLSEGGVIRLSAENITNALSYTPADSAEITPIAIQNIESLFDN